MFPKSRCHTTAAQCAAPISYESPWPLLIRGAAQAVRRCVYATNVFFKSTTGNPTMTPTRIPLHPSTLGRVGRARHTLVAAAVATALGVFSVPAMSAETASAADLQNLQDQIQKLQREVDRMKAQQQAAQTQPAAPPAKPAAGAAPPAPSFMAGPVKVTLGGFV